MRINGRPLSFYKGILVSFYYVPSSFSITTFTSDKGKVNVLGVKPKKQNRFLKIVFESREGLQLFVSELMTEFTVDVSDGYLYFCNTGLQEPAILYKGREIYECTFYVEAEMRGQKKEIILNNTPFFVSGNQEVEGVYTIIPLITLENVELNDIVVRNLTAGNKVVIDGIRKSALENGKNKFTDCELSSFPVLKPGWNEVKVNVIAEQATIICEYWPLYI